MKHCYRPLVQHGALALILSGTVCPPASAEDVDIRWRAIPVTFWFCEVVANGNTRRTLISAESRDKAVAIAPAILNIENPTSTVCY